MEKFPYIFLGSKPMGPIALEALEIAHFSPTAVIDDPKTTLVKQLELVEKYQPTFLLVVSFGAILKRDLLDTVAGQVLNIHPSLLPAYRGPAPVVQTILDDASETGVTLMEIDEQMDHGPILAQEKHPLRGNELPEDLYQVLTKKGVALFLDHIEDYLQEKLTLIPQDHSQATYTHFIKKQRGQLDFSQPADLLEREIRAFHGWPRSWLDYASKRLIIEKAHLEKGKLVFNLVQPEGRKVMRFKEFCAGQRLDPEKFYRHISRH